VSDLGCFWLGAGIGFAGYMLAHGLDSIGDAIRKLAER